MNEYQTIREAAEYLRVSPATLYGWVHQRRVPFRKHGSRVVFQKEDLQKWSQTTAILPQEHHDVCDQPCYLNRRRKAPGAKRSLTTEQDFLEATTLKKGGICGLS